MSPLSPRYSPADVEQKWYQIWRQKGYFRPRENPQRRAFAVVMPPPNVTGVLHLGHALNNTWQDILVRFHRMRGDNTLWLPGTDHAGIHTQMKVDELLRQQGRDRRTLGRDAFVEEVWSWKEQYGGRILEQVARLGASVDWERVRFTLDDGLSQAVTDVFVQLYEEGLLYRGDYITNWCPSCRTALSDIEVEHQEEPGHLTTLRYPLASGAGAILVATTRPETMLGDTAVAVHPDHPRWRHLIGETVRLPLTGRLVPIVADAEVDPEYGTGAVKVTPAHDPNDFAIGDRHHLERIKVIGEDGRMTEAAGRFQGLDRYQARQAVLQALAEDGMMAAQESISHSVGHCEKCATVIEPLLSRQWFVRVKPLAEPAMEAVRRGDVRFVPERFEKIYMNWMENIHDWCVSRQIWWGHRIPAYYCDACASLTVARTAPAACAQCGGPLRQDEDVLDTWFSSALWPFTTLGWPAESRDFALFYPTSVLSTGYDIIFYWVARMIMQGIHFTGQKPFDTVLLHGLVRDAEGRKMSKSLGNGVDPLEVVEKYGADALRVALVLGSAPGNDYRWSWERFEAGSHFANKVYNALRFVLLNWSPTDRVDRTVSVYPADQWIWTRLNDTISAMTGFLEEFEFGQAARSIYDFLWDDYCDWYIEMAKTRIRLANPAERRAALSTLVLVAERALRLLHPVMPFVTEELWQALPETGESIMLAPWPEPERERGDADAVEIFRRVASLVRTGRNLRAEVNLPPGQRVEFVVRAEDADAMAAWRQLEREVSDLLKASAMTWVAETGAHPPRASAGVCLGGTVYLPLEGVVDLEKERMRLTRAREETLREAKRLVRQLDDPQFLTKAPQAVVAKTQQAREETMVRLARLEERLRDLR
ncbi:MAG: valine--tRNA ligase [Thermaerobacter sp.]|nr:valine--tRNA ligase [Thermaerobacter sp.]